MLFGKEFLEVGVYVSTTVLSQSLLRIKRMNESTKYIFLPSIASVTTEAPDIFFTNNMITLNMTLNFVNSWKIAMMILKRRQSQQNTG